MLTLRQTIGRIFARNFACGLLLVASFALAAHLAPRDMQMVPHATAMKSTQAERLIDRHHCWTDEAPTNMRGTIPGHVVITSGNHTRIGGTHMVGQALEQIFDGTDHGLTVHGFCA